MVIADINVGILYVFAISSLGVYGIVLAGWASNSKYPFLGGVRSSSQMISYELSLGLSVIPIFLIVGQLRLTEVVRYQIEHGWMIAPFVGDWTNPGKWLLAIPMLISFFVFMVAIFAETNRLPFDLPEAEQELAGGYNTEYSSMKFALFFLGEYAAMITGSAVIVTLCFGGWHLPLPSWHGGFHWALINGSAAGRGLIGRLFNIVTFFAKVTARCFCLLGAFHLPGFRYDQLMRLGWLIFFELHF
jgi:NADH-quinone oxidoreductase subunit H